MKQVCKYITIPISLWNTPDLSVMEKWILLAIDSVCESANGVVIGVQGIATLTNLSQKEVKDGLKKLYEKKAVDIIVDESGAKCIIPNIFAESYRKTVRPKVADNKPSNTQNIDYDYVMEQYNAICDKLPKISRMTTQRKRKVYTTIKSCDISIADLIKAFRIVSTVSWLNGDNESHWQASFDWITSKPDVLTRILEGVYSKSYTEQQAYKDIMCGADVKKSDTNDFFR